MAEQAYMYLFVREDLSPAQKIIQVAHAVDELNKEFHKYSVVENMFTDSTNFMVLFSVKDEHELLKIHKRLDKQGVIFHLFFEPDLDSYTALATEPLLSSKRKVMENYRLFE